jgi:1-pyrroline-5-carboxylate dehydrogenase
LASFIDQAKRYWCWNYRWGNLNRLDTLLSPTVIVTTNPHSTMATELFGPVMTIFVYEDANGKKLC